MLQISFLLKSISAATYNKVTTLSHMFCHTSMVTIISNQS